MITPETLLEQAISNYTSAYSMNYSVSKKDMDQIVLADSIAWVNRRLKEENFIDESEYLNILAMIHSHDKENLVIAEQIIRNLKFKL